MYHEKDFISKNAMVHTPAQVEVVNLLPTPSIAQNKQVRLCNFRIFERFLIEFLTEKIVTSIPRHNIDRKDMTVKYIALYAGTRLLHFYFLYVKNIFLSIIGRGSKLCTQAFGFRKIHDEARWDHTLRPHGRGWRRGLEICHVFADSIVFKQ